MMRQIASLFLLALLPQTAVMASDEPRTVSASAARPSLASSIPVRSAAEPAVDEEQRDREQLEQFYRDWLASFEVEGLPPDAPKEGALITVDTANNVIYLFKDGELVYKAAAATGMNKTLRHGNRVWLFRTPRGMHPVQRKVAGPVWYKPDWAYVEEKKPIPRGATKDRYVKGKLGRYAFDLGEGIMIHGTDDPKSIGKSVTHGCVRVGDKMLDLLWKEAAVGTPVYIF